MMKYLLALLSCFFLAAAESCYTCYEGACEECVGAGCAASHCAVKGSVWWWEGVDDAPFEPSCPSSCGSGGEPSPSSTTTKAPTAAPSSSTTTKAPTAAPSSSTTTKAPTTTTTPAAGEDPPAGDKACYKFDWWQNDCNDQCNTKLHDSEDCWGEATYGAVYGTPEECRTYCMDTGYCSSSGGGGGGGGGTGACSEETCPPNTASPDWVGTRPAFVGPNCYDSQYGPRFGPDWVPSGRTVVEKVFPDSTVFFRAVQMSGNASPVLSKWATTTGCMAAVGVYENFICAIELLEEGGNVFEMGYTISDFGNADDEVMGLVDVVAFLSHKFKETGGLVAWEEFPSDYYSEPREDYPPQPGAQYHGRGPVQLSWNYNYGAFSEWYYGDKMILLSNPEKLDAEGPAGFIAAFWFWMTPRDFTSGAPLMGTIRTRDAVVHWNDGKMAEIYGDAKYDQYAGLSLSTNVINGGIECSGDPSSANWRVAYFLHVAGRVGLLDKVVTPGDDLDACLNDSFCNGFFRGCSSAASGMTCEPIDTECGPAYFVDWSGHFCH